MTIHYKYTKAEAISALQANCANNHMFSETVLVSITEETSSGYSAGQFLEAIKAVANTVKAYGTSNKIADIKALRSAIPGIGIAEAKDIVEALYKVQ